jgi:hypothetical protein
MSTRPEQRFRHVETCLDYRSYEYAITPQLSQEQYAASRRRLLTIGRADEEKMGVVYVRGPWGFFVIPQHGYPVLRVSFFHDTPTTEMDDILTSISTAFETSDAILEQGEPDE